ncbi:ketohydroxyglutarate aldolase [Spirochaetia bacterium]|nr:ketohydroxyglutarate aldolase [Spirochaetia bacterium]
MNTLFNEELVSKIRKASIVAVLMIDDADHAVPLARALIRGGITAVELTLRTQAALESLKRIRVEVPELLAGVGTILDREQVRQVKEGGALFGVAPGLNPSVVEAAGEYGLPFAPGIMTPSEIELAYSLGCRVMKLFPAEHAGGLDYLNSINAPYAHLGIGYIPLGGVSLENLRSYLEHPAIVAVGGSWLAPRKLVQDGDWDRISRNCEAAWKIVSDIRK